MLFHKVGKPAVIAGGIRAERLTWFGDSLNIKNADSKMAGGPAACCERVRLQGACVRLRSHRSFAGCLHMLSACIYMRPDMRLGSVLQPVTQQAMANLSACRGSCSRGKRWLADGTVKWNGRRIARGGREGGAIVE